MAIKPEIGQSGGQKYDIVGAIQNFLGQMAEHGIDIAAAVIKELLQNADDAGASEVSVILDERRTSADLPLEYRPLLGPAIVVRNNAPFRLKDEVGTDETDDFTAIRDVARGHKRAQATAAGRFGIGFNSVYFLTDTPIVFSRREVHVFDLLHQVFPANGWQFPLDDFPKTSGSLAGPAKNVVQWLFPKATLGDYSFENVAGSPEGDFKEAVVRLPLRNSNEGVQAVYLDRFRSDSERERLLHEMAEQSARAILFLKSVHSVTFGILREERVDWLHNVFASKSPPAFDDFLSNVKANSEPRKAITLACDFNRKVTWKDTSKSTVVEWNFWVRHRADFSDDGLLKMRNHLKKNEERAIPWGAVAVPMDAASIQLDGEIPAWRVFLPLREEGPSACVFCGAFFVGPSRRCTDFRAEGSDEALRKTEWNKALVEKVLVPLLVDSSVELPDRIPNLISEHPKAYLSLFPCSPQGTEASSSLAEHFRHCFAKQPWTLRLFDIWEDHANPVEWLVGDAAASPSIEMVSDSLMKYRDRFATLNHRRRRFVRRAVGEALRERVAEDEQGKICRDVSGDVLRAILSHETPPESVDLKSILERFAQSAGLDPETLDGLWCCVRYTGDTALRYSKHSLYVSDADKQGSGICDSLRLLGLEFEHTEWVKADLGLPILSPERRREIPNLVPADANGALVLLGRVKNSEHDLLSQSRLITPIVDFLVTVPAKQLVASELKLAFLVRTANGKADRRRLGVILLQPEAPSEDETAVWECLFRRPFAEVDPECARDLHRLRKHQPDILQSLSDAECVLRIATVTDALASLDLARSHSAELIQILRDELNKPAHARRVKRAAGALIHEAFLNWDRLSKSERDTVLALPIHRTSAGVYVALIGDGVGDWSTLEQRCHIQTNDDISDAPVALSDCCLLDSAQPSAKRFYRESLQIPEHGRTVVLMEVLRQIGTAADKNLPMLEYLGRYLNEAVSRLSESADEAERRDAAELLALAKAAKSVHCIDDQWRTIAESRDGWDVTQHLVSQGWDRRDIKRLLANLYADVAIAAIDERSRKLHQRVHLELARLDPRDIANCAVTSDCENLDLVERLKLVFDNGNDLHDEVRPSASISNCTLPTLSGAEELVSLVITLAERKDDLPYGLLKEIAPDLVDLAALASQMCKRFDLETEEQKKLQRQLPKLLAHFRVATLDQSQLQQRIADKFVVLSPSLSVDQRLELLERLDAGHLLMALSKLEGKVDSHRPAYQNLIDVLMERWDESISVQSDAILQLRIATCAREFRPLAECFWHKTLNDPQKLDPASRHRMIDTTDASTGQLVDRLVARSPDTLQILDAVATAALSHEPKLIAETPAKQEFLEPWRNWLTEIGNPDSSLHDDALNRSLAIPPSSIQLLVVERIPVCFRLEDGKEIKPSTRWAGPAAFRFDCERVFICADRLPDDLITDVRRIEVVDCKIREQLASLLCKGQAESATGRKTALNFMKETVERPSVVLERLRKTTQLNYFHQYNDQAADPEFAKLYELFVHTKRKSQRRQELNKQLRAIVLNKFVMMRREQIRAYGYDEFSVFAELVQNAEDAYTQRQQLGLDDPPNWAVAFRFEKDKGNSATTLSVEHYGRPFNCWRHGNKEFEAFQKDVEGVLRSSGSFKPHSQTQQGDSQLIGKFGLGFKSVYLLTDAPSVFSGGWNFQIKDGSLPFVVGRPANLPHLATRISLPLLDPDLELRVDAGDTALCLLPFLSQTQQISITHADGCSAVASCSVEKLQSPIPDGPFSEVVTIALSDHGTSREVRLMRVRSNLHPGQLAMLLASDDLPAPWSDAFARRGENGQPSACDLYSALPLKSVLGCGVAVSDQFDLQSGRTHLVDSRENANRAQTIAELLPCLSDAIQRVGQPQLVSERLLRFWNVWRWEKGDAETHQFRKCFAKQLVELSRHSQIVPTLDPAKAASLSDRPFSFSSGVPQPVVEALVAAGFRIEADSGDGPSVFTNGDIVAPGFVRAFRNACLFAEHWPDESLLEVDWALIGKTCKATPWLAIHPGILNAMADFASADAREAIRIWLAECQVKGHDGNGEGICARPRDLLCENDDIRSLLPIRFFKFIDASAYSNNSCELLKLAGTFVIPAPNDMIAIISAQDLTAADALGLLKYLQLQKQWRKYDQIQDQLRGPWFPTDRGRVTVADALDESLLDANGLTDAEFHAWLGLRESPAKEPPPPPPERRSAREILLDLHDWWQEHGEAWTTKYEQRTYVSGQPPNLTPELDLKDRPQRKQWLSLFLLGACHTIGRTKPEQHRGFLQLCDQYNWLDTFADPDSSAQDWIDVLETYLDQPTNDIQYYHWAKLFVPIFHLSHWLAGYIQQFANLGKRGPFNLNQITVPRCDPDGSGGDIDAPSIMPTLGIGACFVVRELCRLKIVVSNYAHEHCFVPSGQIRALVEHHVASAGQFPSSGASPSQSVRIYTFLCEQIGDKAIFDGSYDLPLLALAEDEALQLRILGYHIPKRPSAV